MPTYTTTGGLGLTSAIQVFQCYNSWQLCLEVRDAAQSVCVSVSNAYTATLNYHTNVWTHVALAVTLDTSYIHVKWWVNGVVDNSADISYPSYEHSCDLDVPRASAVFGRRAYDGSIVYGGMGEVAFYNYALTDAQVATHYGARAALSPPPSPPPPPAPPASGNCSAGNSTYLNVVLSDNPWAYWRLAETSGTVANDCSRNGSHSGTYVGCVTLGTEGLGPSSPAAPFAPMFNGAPFFCCTL